MQEKMTPLQTLALAGILQNSLENTKQCFSLSSDLLTAISNFGQSPFASLSQNCLNSNGPKVIAAIKNMPGFLTGYVQEQYKSQVPGNIDIDYNNLINGLLTQSTNLTKIGNIGIISLLQKSNDFCSANYQIYKMISQMATKNSLSNTAGYKYLTPGDMVTIGFSNQFGDLSSQAFRQFCTNLIDFGTMFSASDVSLMFRASSLIRNLFRKGFTEVLATALNNEGVSVSAIENTQESILIRALNNVPIGYVRTIIEVTGYRSGSGQTITMLGQVLDYKIAFGPLAKTLFADFDDLTKKMIAVLGLSTNLSFVNDLGLTMQNIRTPKLSSLEVLSSDTVTYADTLKTASLSSLGTGSGIYGNPTIKDLLGSFAGVEYVKYLKIIIQAHTELIQTVRGKALVDSLTQAFTNRASFELDDELAATVNLAYTAMVSETQTSVVRILNSGQDSFNRIFEMLVKEKRNLALAGIDYNNSNFSISDVMTFVLNLPNLHLDTESLGYGNFIQSICSNNIYGEAVRAAIDEGFNQTLLNNVGIEVVNTLITDQPIGDQANDSTQCCP